MSEHERDGRRTRREAIATMVAAVAGLALGSARASAATAIAAGVTHPEPRPGITAEKVLPADQVPAQSQRAYAAAREIPQVLDGLYCHCECGKRDNLRSLLSCFETRMPTTCGICRDEAELALAEFLEGRSLRQIRAAVDRKFG